MAGTKRAKKKKYARLGDVIVIPLENESFGLAHVVAQDGRSAGLVMSEYVGPKPSSLDDAPVKPYLREPSVSRGGTLDGPPVPATRWVSAPLERGYSCLGTRPPTATEAKVKIATWAGGWENLAGTILVLFFRKHDKKAERKLLAKWDRKRAEAVRKHDEKEKKRAEGLTLAKLARGMPLASWSKDKPAKAVEKARAILRGVAREIAALDPKTEARTRMDAIRRGVEAFNALDGMWGLSILTTEREDICAAFLDITRAAKMKTTGDPTGRWRDW
jgi:hypothetical protein